MCHVLHISVPISKNWKTCLRLPSHTPLFFCIFFPCKNCQELQAFIITFVMAFLFVICNFLVFSKSYGKISIPRAYCIKKHTETPENAALFVEQLVFHCKLFCNIWGMHFWETLGVFCI